MNDIVEEFDIVEELEKPFHQIEDDIWPLAMKAVNEIKLLRSALKEIAEHPYWWGEETHDMRAIARVALEGK